MRSKYRGYTIEVERNAGWTVGAAWRDSDGFTAIDFARPDVPVRSAMSEIKQEIDEALASDDPWDEQSEAEWRAANGWYRCPGGWSSVPVTGGTD